MCRFVVAAGDPEAWPGDCLARLMGRGVATVWGGVDWRKRRAEAQGFAPRQYCRVEFKDIRFRKVGESRPKAGPSGLAAAAMDQTSLRSAARASLKSIACWRSSNARACPAFAACRICQAMATRSAATTSSALPAAQRSGRSTAPRHEGLAEEEAVETVAACSAAAFGGDRGGCSAELPSQVLVVAAHGDGQWSQSCDQLERELKGVKLHLGPEDGGFRRRAGD